MLGKSIYHDRNLLSSDLGELGKGTIVTNDTWVTDVLESAIEISEYTMSYRLKH